MRRRLAAVLVILLLSLEVASFPPSVVRALAGESTARQNPDGTVTVFFQGNSSDSIDLHWSVVNSAGDWLNVTDTAMSYDHTSGNFSATVGPFPEGTEIQWVFHDLTTDAWYNLNGQVDSNWSYTLGAPVPEGGMIRMSVSTDKYTYSLVDSVVATIEVTNLQTETLSNLTISNVVYDQNDVFAMNLPTVQGVSIPPLSTEDFNVSSSFSLRDENYLIISTASSNSSKLGTAEVPLVVLDTSGREPLTLAMVFHMHQPIYLNLQGQFEQPWVQVHSGGDFEYNGVWYGAYLWYVLMLESHPGVKVTFNLQPSLLYQWNVSMFDFQYNGSFPGGEAALSRDLVAINQTVAGYRQLASDGQAEILTSPFYHPLGAILVRLGLSSDLLAQIELGRNYTKSFMGVTADGMWTPEMGFTMAMVPLMQEAGIRYTVLDGQYQFQGAGGPSSNSSMYQPFDLEGANGSHIVVFFRDTQISEDFTSVWNSIPNPRVAASDFMAAVASVYRSSPGAVLTIASDGENPIVQGDELISALDYNAIFGAIQSQSWLQTSTLGSIVAQRPITANLTSVPDNSWSGGFGLWIGSPSKDAIWQAILQARQKLVNLTSEYGSSNPEIEKLWNYLYIAEGSDWEWQTPSGPAWFAMQGLRYANAAADYVAPPVSAAPVRYQYVVYSVFAAAALAVAAVILWRRRRNS